MKKDNTAKAEAATKATLGIIIPVRNDSGHVMRLLTEIGCQLRKINAEVKDAKGKARVKVLVMDDASTDETPKLVASAAERADYPLYLKRTESRKGAGGARNEGRVYASLNWGVDYICYFDADDMLRNDALQSILAAIDGSGADCIEWGFRTMNRDPNNDVSWIPKYPNPDDWVKIPVAPWLHAIRTRLCENFPTELLTDDAIWWYRQAEILQDVGATFFFIHEPLYIYDRRVGGCTRASEFFREHPQTLEQAAMENTCLTHGYPDRYVSDCLRNLAEFYDMRNQLTGEVKRQMLARFRKDIAACLMGRWGW